MEQFPKIENKNSSINYEPIVSKLLESKNVKNFISRKEIDEFIGRDGNLENLLISFSEKSYLFHGSNSLIDNSLEPREASDISNNPKNKQNAVYATNIPSIAMYMGLISINKIKENGIPFKYGIDVEIENGAIKPIFLSDKPVEKMMDTGYVYILKKEDFDLASDKQKEWQFVSTKEVKPELVFEILPSDFNHEIFIKKTDSKDISFDEIEKSSIGNGKLYELKENPEKIIRVEKIDNLLYKHNGLNTEKLLLASKILFDELKNKYGIISPVEFGFIKNEKGDQSIYSSVDRVYGKHFEELNNTDEIKNKISNLYGNISQYFLDKYQKKEPYIWDINGESQYVYGKKKGDLEDTIYLVDTDIWLSKNQNDMYLSLYWLCFHMSGLEDKFDTKFKKARSNIKKFTELPVPENLEELNLKCLESVKEFLEDKIPSYMPESAIPRFE